MNKQNKNIEAIYPLSSTQEGILFHTLYAPESGIYFQQLNFTLQGNLQVQAFQEAWQRVVERHQALRTLFLWESREKPLQVVLKSVNLPWENLDWQHLSSSEQQERLQAFKQSELEQQVPLNQAPLMRWRLIQLQADTYELIWSHHHLVTDGWSMSIILQEVLAFYQAFDKNENISLPPVRPYRDYIAWLDKHDFEQAKTFWQKTLDGFTNPTPLIVDRSATNRISLEKSAYEQQYLSAKTTTALQSLAKQNFFTLNTIVQGAWALLLSRYSGESDIVFGVTVSGRPPTLSGVESMVGLFINTVPIRIQVPKDIEVLPWLKQLFSQQMERDLYSYSPLVEIQANSQVSEGMPLFESLLVFENYPLDESSKHQFGSLEITNITGVEQTNYPLSAIAIPGSELLIRISYDTERFDAATISRMLGHFQTLLQAIAANPFQRLFEVPLLTNAEKNQLLVEWNETKTNYPYEADVVTLFEQQTENNPQAIAAIYEDLKLTYQQLNSRANQLARHLQSMGVGTEVLVGVCIERSLDMIVAMLGILKAGGAYVPLDPAYPQERLAYMLEDAGISVLVSQSQLTANLPEHRAKVVCLDTDWIICNYSSDNPKTEVTPTNLAYVMYTSGSTGKPKGVAVPHQAIVRLVKETNYVQITSDECIAQASNANFDAATFEIWGALLNGAKFVGITKEVMLSPEQLHQQLNKDKITILFITTALFNQLVSFRTDIFQSLRTLLFGGEAVNPSWVEAVLKNKPPERLLHVYGPTESTTFATWYLIEQVTAGATNIPIGRPISNTTLYVLDRNQQPVPIGVPGELYIGGDGLARGYLNRPELTDQKFVANPFSKIKNHLYKTGDLVRYLVDGNIEFLGRIDNQVKIRGFRIELGEIESVLSRHPAVQKSVVVVREDDLTHKQLVAYIVPIKLKTEGEYVNQLIHDLQFYLKQKLPNFMLPSFFVMLDALPLTPNGKLDRDALPPPDPKSRYEITYIEPKTDTEKKIAEVWQKLLSVEKVGLDDNFFNLGGHSLLATQMISRLRAAFEIDLSLRSVFDNPTVAALATFVTELQLAEAQADALEKILAEVEQLPEQDAQQQLNGEKL
ncbi:non-ribosomal peptide synthetase [Tolypothrix sp. VBCCA 56010]|uniref:non-ribosomal peptide synthetase n=1 Tax=Tolypothrix sp. VBCCA 56010 TaxID=3137731 RepID=UPI003D7C6DA9